MLRSRTQSQSGSAMSADEGPESELDFLGSLFLHGVSVSTFLASGEGRCESNWTRHVTACKDGLGRSCDFWNRSQEDVRLAKNLGVNAFRLTIEWHRLEPVEGGFDMDAFARYTSIIRSIQAAGMTVVATLHHFVHPAWFEAKGAFAEDLNIPFFIRFVKRVVQTFTGELQMMVTFDEAAVYAVAGNILGVYPPGGVMGFQKAGKVLLNMLKAHTQAYKAIKQTDKEIQVGFVHRFIDLNSISKQAADSPMLAATANGAFATDVVLRWFCLGVFEWQGPLKLNSILIHRASSVPPLDFLGVNAAPPPPLRIRMPSQFRSIVDGSAFTDLITSARFANDDRTPHATPQAVSSAPDREAVGGAGGQSNACDPVGDAAQGQQHACGEETQAECSETGAQAMAKHLRAALLQAGGVLGKPLYVMDLAFDDAADVHRPRALKALYCAILDAMQNGADVHGVFYWTLTDTFDWTEGFSKHYGMYSVAAGTLERRARRSSINLMQVVHSVLPQHVEAVVANVGWCKDTISSFWCEETPKGQTQWRFLSKDLAGLVVLSADFLPHMLLHVGAPDIGAVMLTCKTWHAAMKRVLKTSRAKVLSWDPKATSLLCKHGQAPVALANLPNNILLHCWGPAPERLGEATWLAFEDRNARPVQHDDVSLIVSQVGALRGLNMRDHNLRVAGMQQLVAPLSSLTALSWLDLGYNTLGAEGMDVLAPALRALRKLRWLSLRANELQPDGASVLAAALGACSLLTELHLSNNGLGLLGAQALAAPLHALPALRMLDLRWNELQDSGVRALVQGWSKPNALTKLWFEGNNVRSSTKGALPASWHKKIKVDW